MNKYIFLGITSISLVGLGFYMFTTTANETQQNIKAINNARGEPTFFEKVDHPNAEEIKRKEEEDKFNEEFERTYSDSISDISDIDEGGGRMSSKKNRRSKSKRSKSKRSKSKSKRSKSKRSKSKSKKSKSKGYKSK